MKCKILFKMKQAICIILLKKNSNVNRLNKKKHKHTNSTQQAEILFKIIQSPRNECPPL